MVIIMFKKISIVFVFCFGMIIGFLIYQIVLHIALKNRRRKRE